MFIALIAPSRLGWRPVIVVVAVILSVLFLTVAMSYALPGEPPTPPPSPMAQLIHRTTPEASIPWPPPDPCEWCKTTTENCWYCYIHLCSCGS